MKRRDALKSASAVVTVSTVGLAGCSSGGGGGGNGGGNTDCETPGENLADSFPDGGGFELDSEVATTRADSKDDVEVESFAYYTGSGDGRTLLQIDEYSSADVAKSETDTVSEQGSGYAGTVGYIQTGAYIFSVIAGDEGTAKDLLKASPTLSDDCVEDNVKFA